MGATCAIPAHAGRGIRVHFLVADSDDTFAMPLSQRLRRLGSVSLVRSGNGARAALLSGFPPVTAALCAVDLPGIDGYRLLQEMRSLRADVARRLLFYTANPKTFAARAVAHLHVRPLLPKPFSLAQVETLLEEIKADAL